MRRLQMLLIGFGILALGGGLYAVAVGKLKWSEDRMLEGATARLAGVGCAVMGAALLAAGLFVPRPIWETF